MTLQKVLIKKKEILLQENLDLFLTDRLYGKSKNYKRLRKKNQTI